MAADQTPNIPRRRLRCLVAANARVDERTIYRIYTEEAPAEGRSPLVIESVLAQIDALGLPRPRNYPRT